MEPKTLWDRATEGESVRVHAAHLSSTASPSTLLRSFSLSAFFSPVKDSSPCKFNQAAWIKAIIQFVYKTSFILCQTATPLTIGGLLTPDLCWGHMMHLLQCSTRVFQAVIRRQEAKHARWESCYSNLRNAVTECKAAWPYQQTRWTMKMCLNNYSWWYWICHNIIINIIFSSLWWFHSREKVTNYHRERERERKIHRLLYFQAKLLWQWKIVSSLEYCQTKELLIKVHTRPCGV